MGYPTKIATCCYCGTRAALVLTGKHRHELSCSGCGALHDLKMLPKDRTGDREILHDRPQKSGKPRSRSRKRRNRKFIWQILEEAFDTLEETFRLRLRNATNPDAD